MTESERKVTTGSASRRWSIVAALVLTLGTATLFRPLLGSDLYEAIPADPEGAGMEDAGMLEIYANDLRFVTSVIARNAYTLLTSPDRIFELESCFPTRTALALGEPMITQGIIGMPAYALTQDPIATFNLVLIASTLISALAMFWLVREWTGVPAAGIVAALYYAFHTNRMVDVAHFYVWDGAWTLFAMLFASRLFKEPRWRDSIGFAFCCAMQMAGSFYPLLAAALLALPLGAWFIARFGLRRLDVAQACVILALVALSTFIILGPYLEHRAGGLINDNRPQFFLPLSWYAQEGRFFPGWSLPALALVGFTFARKATAGGLGENPRWALLTGGLLSLELAVGGIWNAIGLEITGDEGMRSSSLNLYLAFSKVIPGLEVIRAPAALCSGTHLVACILAGLAAAALLRSSPQRYTAFLATAMIFIAYADTLSPRFLGLEPRVDYQSVPLSPDPKMLDFYSELELRGSSGPIFEVPSNSVVFEPRTRSILLMAYHHRPTSQCYNSFLGSEKNQLREISLTLPDKKGFRSLREMGFTTLVVHHNPAHVRALLRQRLFAHFARRSNGRIIRRIYGNEIATGYEIGE